MTTQEELVRALELVLALHERQSDGVHEAARALLATYEATGDHVHWGPGEDCNACRLRAALEESYPVRLDPMAERQLRDALARAVGGFPRPMSHEVVLWDEARRGSIGGPVKLPRESQCSEACDSMTDLQHEEHHGELERAELERERGCSICGAAAGPAPPGEPRMCRPCIAAHYPERILTECADCIDGPDDARLRTIPADSDGRYGLDPRRYDSQRVLCSRCAAELGLDEDPMPDPGTPVPPAVERRRERGN